MVFKWGSSLIVAAFLASIVALVWNIPARAQGDVAQSSEVQIPAPTLRTVEEMQSDAMNHVRPVAPEGPEKDLADYRAAKAAANSAAPSAKPGFPEGGGPKPLATIGDMNCFGSSQVDFYPPDADGGVGFDQFVQIVNSEVVVWDKTPDPSNPGCLDLTVNPQLDVDLNSFFGYFAEMIFDPRVLHDDTFGRWLIFGEAFPEASGAQYQFIAVSAGEDAAAGPYSIFAFDLTRITCPTCLWNFTQAGMDDGAIILTGYVFNPDFVFSRWLILNKMHLYDIRDFTGCFFFGGEINLPSWAPPKVIDLSNTTYMIEGQPGEDIIVDGLVSTDRVCPIIVNSRAVPDTSYDVPPNALQPGTDQVLETRDGRFENRSLQVGNSLYQVRTELQFGFPAPHFFRINLADATVLQDGLIMTSPTSYDFNPSITANIFNTAAVVYSSTNANPGDQVDVRMAVKADADASFGPSARVYVSGAPITGNVGFDNVQRFGDYSSITIDPANPGRAWFANEIEQPELTGWGTRWGNVLIPKAAGIAASGASRTYTCRSHSDRYAVFQGLRCPVVSFRVPANVE
jgi:hypothetical protein